MDYPIELIAILSHFSILFSAPTREKGKLLVIGALLCPRRRTVAAILRIMGRRNESDYENYHRVLNRAKWSALSAGRILLGLLVRLGLSPVPGRLIFVLDETVERRQGKKIKAKGCYRDAVRSSESCVIKCFGLKWVCSTILVQLPWCKRPWTLPYLTVLAHSKKANREAGKRHKTCVDIAGQVVMITVRWLRLLGSSAQVIFLGDGGYAAIKFMQTCIRLEVTLICRFRPDAALYDWPAIQPKSKRGRKPIKGKRQRSLKDIATDPSTKWTRRKEYWYGGIGKELDTIDRILKEEGFSPLPKRTSRERKSSLIPTLVIPKSRKLTTKDLKDDVFTSTKGASALIFLPLIEEPGIIDAMKRAGFPSTSVIPMTSYILSLLALKLIGIKRHSHDKSWNMDRGLGLFAGLNVLPKKCTIVIVFLQDLTIDEPKAFVRNC